MSLVSLAKKTEQRIGMITLNAPPLNISTKALKDELNQALSEIECDPHIAVILINAVGEKAFSVGSDIRELQQAIQANKVRERAEHENALNNRIENLGKVTIAVIHGFALGGGLELALACDFRVADVNAKLAFPEIKLALFPGGGGSERLPRLVGYSKALELMLTGESIDASEAKEIGLVNRIAIERSALEEAMLLAESIAGFSLSAIRRIKNIARRGLTLDFAEANRLAILDSERAFFDPDGQEGIRAFLEKRAPNFSDRES